MLSHPVSGHQTRPRRIDCRQRSTERSFDKPCDTNYHSCTVNAAANTSPAVADLRVDGQRLWQTLERFAQIGATARGGCNRQALTDDDRAGRDLFTAWGKQAGCETTVDTIGNLYLRRRGLEDSLAPVLASTI